MASRLILSKGNTVIYAIRGWLSGLLAVAAVLNFQEVTSGRPQPEQLSNGTDCQLATYTQQLVIVFTNETAAKQATISIEPLHDGYHRAVSCRWDDNWTSDNLPTREVMKKFGIRGTWYLNGRHFSPEGKPADYLPIARELLDGGNSIGGHSLTHPYLTYYHSNRMFAETSGVRVTWEAALDQPVLSYAYSFVDLRPEPEGKEVLSRTLRTLSRAGFYHIAEYLNFFSDLPLTLELSHIMPPENNSLRVFREAVNWAYNDAQLSEKWPMISNSMHAWYGTSRLEYGYNELRSRLQLLAGLENVWHCNQNQYAAYRRQFRCTKLSTPVYQRHEVTLEIQGRPELLALDDSTPLTISINGVEPDQVIEVRCPTASVSPSDRDLSDRRLFHVGHDNIQVLPVKIGHIANPNNSKDHNTVKSDPDFVQLRGILWVEDEQLRLKVTSEGEHSLTDMRVVWRVPIGWDVASIVEHIPRRVKGHSVVLSQALFPSDNPQDRLGRAHFAAQLDFKVDGEPGRIHFTCQQCCEQSGDSWPMDGFALLGPIPNEELDSDTLSHQIEREGCPNHWTLADGTVLAWRKHARDGYINHAWLNPEYVRTTGTWNHVAPSYMLRSKVDSPTDRQVLIVVSHAVQSEVLINGAHVEAGRADFHAGENDLVIIYPGSTMSMNTPRLSACFVRLTDPATGARLEDIQYHAY